MSEHEQTRYPDLIPKDHAEALRRFETVRPLDSASLAELEKQEFLLAWWSFCWLESALHPDDVEAWPEDVAEARPLAVEALRRYEAGEINDSEYYPDEAVRDRILKARAKDSQSQPEHQEADTSET